MQKQFLMGLAALGMVAVITPSLAQEENLCLDCHEPAEDWEGMSVEEILVEAKNPDVKRHADNRELSDEQLQALITPLVQ